ncbi:hypothetical protein C475_19498 [Halosimplex carlsbadense 2-9-1]|uniref:Uncharacterized protein n=2 Tax=Halosimplex carlsbadense TaxID=171164 RepID=M0CEM4_9EURY|nr:hypothetical protein C475_19498 [Halosimplex carlsbadense 2-9-1]
MAHDGGETDSVEELLDDHPEIEMWSWKHGGEEVYVSLDNGKLAGRAFLDDMEERGMGVKFVDFATSRIGFSRE